MGWCNDDDDHEGYVQGVVRSGYGWRDLGLDDTATLDATQFCIQVACSCGWRSERMSPPLDAEWAPCSVFMSGADEDAAHAIWRSEHRDGVTGTYRHLRPMLSR